VDPLIALEKSTGPLVSMVSTIRPEQWAAPTPCTDWDVRTLVGHLIATTNAYVELLGGASPAYLLDEMAKQRDAGGDDPVAALTSAVDACQRAFAEPGALDRPVQHLIGDVNGARLLGIRISENVIHGYDLATALDVDAGFDDDIVETVYERLAPQADTLPSVGYFNAPNKQLGSDATTVEKLLHIVGR
jgi:uncharacterized protein (TIGR03086 family)